MISLESIKYSLKNLEHRKGRSFLTVFSILVGIITIFIFISFGMGLYGYVNSFTTGTSANKLIISAKGAGVGALSSTLSSTVPLNNSDIKAIEKVPGVNGVTGMYIGPAKVEKFGESKYAYIGSYDPNDPMMLDIMQVGIDKGRLLRPQDGAAVVLGHDYIVAGKIFDKALKVNDVITVNNQTFRIVGFLQPIGNPTDDTDIFITNKEFEKLYPNSNYYEIIARVDINTLNLTIGKVETALRRERGEKAGMETFFVQSFQDMLKSYSSVLNIIIGFIILIALISVLVSAINTANTMITSVLERYKEIGVLKAVGARNSNIFSLFLFESSFLGLVAGILGVGFGYLITYVAGKILSSLGWSFLAPGYSWILFVGCILFATVTGAISGALPAIRASKINTVDALRYE